MPEIERLIWNPETLSLTRSQILVGQHELHVAQAGLGRDDHFVEEGTESIHFEGVL
jgi:hypothetical protein